MKKQGMAEYLGKLKAKGKLTPQQQVDERFAAHSKSGRGAYRPAIETAAHGAERQARTTSGKGYEAADMKGYANQEWLKEELAEDRKKAASTPAKLMRALQKQGIRVYMEGK